HRRGRPRLPPPDRQHRGRLDLRPSGRACRRVRAHRPRDRLRRPLSPEAFMMDTPRRMPRVVVLGSSNTDMTVRLPQLPRPGETRLGGAFAMGPGGKGANQAVAARRAGAEVRFVAAVGDDSLGQQALQHYQQEGIKTEYVRTVSGTPSGVALIFIAE